MMLGGNTGMPNVPAVYALLSSAEASEFGALSTTLPEGWVMELRPEAGMAWVVFVYEADAPRNSPMFTVCRWDDGVGMFAQWMDGSASSAMAFTELRPILELILNRISRSRRRTWRPCPPRGGPTRSTDPRRPAPAPVPMQHSPPPS